MTRNFSSTKDIHKLAPPHLHEMACLYDSSTSAIRTLFMRLPNNQTFTKVLRKNVSHLRRIENRINAELKTKSTKFSTSSRTNSDHSAKNQQGNEITKHPESNPWFFDCIVLFTQYRSRNNTQRNPGQIWKRLFEGRLDWGSAILFVTSQIRPHHWFSLWFPATGLCGR